MSLTNPLERIYDVGAFLLDCACQGLDVTEAGCPERRCLVGGTDANVEAVNCCAGQGQLTVNVTRIYPSRSFPVPDVGSPNNCDAPYTVVTYNVEVLRCSPVGSPERAPDCDKLDSVAYTTMTDMAAVRNGVTCCLRDEERSNPVIGNGYRWALGDHLTIGPEGGCVGSDLTVLVGYLTCWEC